MKPTLKWKNGRCTNPPPEWCVEAISRVDGTWVVWVQQSRSNVVLASHSTYEWPSQEAAQLACEVALWRLGVLSLPGWTKHGKHLECHRILDGGSFRAEVSLWRGLGRATWVHVGRGPHAMTACDLHMRGPWYAVVVAKSQAETALRALIAAALEGGA